MPLKAHCTNVIQLWTRVKFEFKPSSAAKCVAPKRFKLWSPFNSEPPSEQRSNLDLGSSNECWDTRLCCCKKLSDSNLILLFRIKL